ncbi:MAG: hypothetical protein K6B44_11390 [Lachnospiraceae bacterium]|nr:hypothetical protein [Lachnospiraceae bacterium]
MGKNNNCLLNYLSDKARFADMINAELYGGRQVIRPEKLTEISANTYQAVVRGDEAVPPKRQERRGDLAMKYEDGVIYRVFLAEAQDKVLYTLPLRTMDYLTATYKKQHEQIKRDHDRNNDYESISEKFSGLNKTDRLKPTYLLWLYHGEEAWDGPRKLRDMMDFGDDRDGFNRIFQDFTPHLLCINEMKDTNRYNTELKALLDMLRRRSDKKALQELVTGDKTFRLLDEETYEAASVLMNVPSLWKKRKRYSDEGRNYDMCKALQDWEAEIREESAAEIAQKNAVIERKDEEIEQKTEELIRKNAEIDSLEKRVAELEARLAAANG